MSKSIHILHVDDEPDFAQLSADFLEREFDNLDIETATSASEGVDRLANGDFDCIVSDYDMPGQNGIEFLEAVRVNYPDLPFILYTGKGSEEVASEAISAGVTDYLQKESGTGQYTVLANRVMNAVERMQAQRQRQRSERRFEAIFEDPHLLVGVLDPDGSLRDANQTAMDYIEADQDTVTGERFWETPWWAEEVRSDVKQWVERAASGEYVDFEATHTTPEGTPRSITGTIRPVTNNAGEIVSLIASGRDVTEHKEREQTLREEREFIDQALDTLDDVFYVVGADGTLRRWNARLSGVTGYTDEEIATMQVTDFFPEDERETIADGIDEALTTGGVVVEADFQTVEGDRIPHEFTGSRLTDSDDDPTGLIGIGRDITERMERERELEQEKRRFETIFENCNDAIFLLDVENDAIKDANPQGADLLGYPREELVSSVAISDVHPDHFEEFRAFIDTVKAEGHGWTDEYHCTTRNDDTVEAEISMAPIELDGTSYVLANVRDITERKERARELEHQRSVLESVVETVPDGILVVDENREFFTYNTQFVDMWDIPDEIVETGDDQQALESVLDKLERPDEFLETVEYFYDHPGEKSQDLIHLSDGRVFDRYTAPAKDDEVNYGRIWVFRDITERKQREQTIEVREQALRSAYKIIADEDRSVSEKIDALLEGARSHIGTDYATFSHLDGDQYEFEAVAVSAGIDLEAGTTAPLEELPTYERAFQTGQTLVIDEIQAETPELVDPARGIACYLGVPVVVNGEPYGTFCFYDVDPRSEPFSDWEVMFVELLGDWVGSELTRQRTYEHLQRQNEKLDDFSNVVSHDLRNPLNMAGNWLELVREDCESEYLDNVEHAHDRMRALIEDMLTLARETEGVGELDSVDLREIAESCWNTVETGRATLVTETDRTIRADPGRLQQLLENLIRNSVDHGGREVTVTIGESNDGFYVADDGSGIPAAERDEVFESGYSTTQEGTGFGLSIVRKIAEAHDWEIRVTASDGGGARFEITGVEFVR